MAILNHSFQFPGDNSSTNPDISFKSDGLMWCDYSMVTLTWFQVHKWTFWIMNFICCLTTPRPIKISLSTQQTDAFLHSSILFVSDLHPHWRSQIVILDHKFQFRDDTSSLNQYLLKLTGWCISAISLMWLYVSDLELLSVVKEY